MAIRMLVNSIHREETRVALADENQLLELEIERKDQVQLKGNIYKAKVSRIEPSLQAAFLDIGSSRNGFLQINDVNPSYYCNLKATKDYDGKKNKFPEMSQIFKKDQDLVVQVVKDERDEKGATLTTNISIPGRYLVLMVGTSRGGVSRKIADESKRKALRSTLDKLKTPPGMTVIVRTAGLNKSYEELQEDLNILINTWNEIVKGSLGRESLKLLYKEKDLSTRFIRDYLRGNVDEILVDDDATYDEISKFIELSAPHAKEKLKKYDRTEPIFSHYGIDTQVQKTTKPEVTLESGGSIVITPTEAIVAIDVNSGRSTSQSGVEQTAYNTNLEAAKEIAHQLRFRDLGGLIVVDFIDMFSRKYRLGVEKALKDAVRDDRAKVEIGKISKFGLLEMSRQRLKSSITSQNYQKCPSCSGSGWVKSPESASLEVLRKIENAVSVGGVKDVKVRMSPASALFLLNEKRRFLTKLEIENEANILIYADSRVKSDDYMLMLDSSVTTAEEEPVKSPKKNNSNNKGKRRRSSRPQKKMSPKKEEETQVAENG